MSRANKISIETRYEPVSDTFLTDVSSCEFSEMVKKECDFVDVYFLFPFLFCCEGRSKQERLSRNRFFNAFKDFVKIPSYIFAEKFIEKKH